MKAAKKQQISINAKNAGLKGLKKGERCFMSRGVLATFKIMPESPEVDLEALKNTIKTFETIGDIRDFKEEPIAFGLKSLSVLTLIADEGGLTEKIETKLSELEGVQSVETVGVTLI